MFLIKNLAKKIVAKILCLEARLIIKRYQPKVVGVTGSVGKTSTKDAIAKVLAVKYQVRKSEKSYNSEFGLPLTIIGAKSAWNSSLGWLEIIARGLWVAISGQKYPEWLVLEVGADRPGDIKNVVKWLPIDIGVLTRLPAVPVHIEFFKNKHQYLEEKISLVKSLTEAGWAILNFDDPVIKDLIDKLKARVISYGHTSEAKILISNEQLYYDNDQLAGLNFKLDYVGDSLPVRLSGIIGRHQIGAATAAFAVGVTQGINLVEIVEALSGVDFPPGRLRVLTGIKNTILLDDTYNASPTAMQAGLESLAEIGTIGRKVAVLADMMELGEHTVEEHRKIGSQVAGIVNELILVGLRSRFIAEGAIEAGMDKKKIHQFDEAVEAGKYLQKIIAKGDIIYFKGSQSMRMEKAVEEVMAEPEKKEKLLVRQEKEWLGR
ncbi:MAG: hypothetical protein A2607_01940 [Candidatus Vogelbacteria bacterium RIFOXYD1_FULL_42_15]|uniref:UDP-N-acetylmuramoyl-tripeptide--D-alanyl-D-alanine ligase n=1 Tax=Candidatus Vogelbacteria bacterium RIFOXYD1_FULL_42_15 TaxID=1802437 RepID=A0A1G2QIS4_9BACT|nr:MAG: hypothetical protein A2607_01940 [Candidatus Vogelbacteria bacterium RIFOXYD1_FULL_42_15]